jgi:DNA-binding MarR family transcriptional regulator
MDINRELKPYDLHSSQYIFLVQLYKKNHVSQDCLSKELMIDKSATARAIKQLESKGYVTREINPDDKRSYFVCLTEKSMNIKKDLRAILSAWNKKLTKSLGLRDYEMAYNLLEKMAVDVLDKKEFE